MEEMEFEWIVCPQCGNTECEKYFNSEIIDMFCDACAYEERCENTTPYIGKNNYVLPLEFTDETK